jgi:SEL1 protein
MGARDPSRLNDLLAFYSYHANGGSLSHTLWLARIYYQGSIYGASESAGQVPRDFIKARELASKVAKMVWPVEITNLRMVKGRRVTRNPNDRSGQGGEEDPIMKTEASVRSLAGSAAALLGRMYLRGEGVPVDYARAWYWFWRGSEVGDRDCKYGFGLMRSSGMAPDQWVKKDGKVIREGQNIDRKRAIEMWDDAVKSSLSGHAESSVALGKIHLQMGDLTSAGAHFATAVRTGSPFEGFYFLGLVNAKVYKQSLATLSPPGANDNRCQAAVSFFKHAAERGDWESPVFARGVRAWELGDKKRALIYWSMAAERGDEVAQNNVAWILDRDKRRWKVPRLDGTPDTSSDRLALMYWTRSAAQDNVDALVKLGDYYYYGIGLPTASSNASSGEPEYEKALACYASAADRQVSALAYWNLGHLYEAGLGVPRRDFHLAKRYYDMAVEINSEAYLPVLLSLIRLHIKALWATVWKREESAVALFSSYAGAGPGALGGYTEAEEELLRAAGGGREDDEDWYFDDEGGDLNLPESWDLRRNARGGQQAQRPGQQQQQPQQQQQQQPSPPQQQQQEPQQQQGGAPPPKGAPNAAGRAGGHGGEAADGSVLMSLSEEEADAMIEGAMMVIGLSALAMLVYARQAAQARAEQERREEERRRQEVRNHIVVAEGGGQAAGEALRAQEAEWHRRDQQPGGPRYAGGLPWPPGPEVGL